METMFLMNVIDDFKRLISKQKTGFCNFDVCC